MHITVNALNAILTVSPLLRKKRLQPQKHRQLRHVARTGHSSLFISASIISMVVRDASFARPVNLRAGETGGCAKEVEKPA